MSRFHTRITHRRAQAYVHRNDDTMLFARLLASFLSSLHVDLFARNRAHGCSPLLVSCLRLVPPAEFVAGDLPAATTSSCTSVHTRAKNRLYVKNVAKGLCTTATSLDTVAPTLGRRRFSALNAPSNLPAPNIWTTTSGRMSGKRSKRLQPTLQQLESIQRPQLRTRQPPTRSPSQCHPVRPRCRRPLCQPQLRWPKRL